MDTKFYQVIKKAAEDKKALELVYCDTKEQLNLCDGHIICYGQNYRHVQTLAKNITAKVQEDLDNLKPNASEGEAEGRWILLDYGAVFVHVMEKSLKSHYKLEDLWSKANK